MTRVLDFGDVMFVVGMSIIQHLLNPVKIFIWKELVRHESDMINEDR